MEGNQLVQKLVSELVSESVIVSVFRPATACNPKTQLAVFKYPIKHEVGPFGKVFLTGKPV